MVMENNESKIRTRRKTFHKTLSSSFFIMILIYSANILNKA